MNESLANVIEPRSVAVVGASRDPTKRGYQAVRTLLESDYSGRVYPVNPSGGELLGLPIATSVLELTDTPDLAFICTPAQSVPAILERCAQKGIRAAVVSAVGFRETGAEGASLERDMHEIASRNGIRVVGPNTSGVLNTSIGLNLVGVRAVKAGRLALLAQSGNVGLALMNEASERCEGLSVYVGVGNETDIAFHEYVEYLNTHEATAAILMYVEGFRDGRGFIDVARRVSTTKPIVLLKGGRSERGVVSARSHTGAIAGSYPVLRAALRRGGVIEVLRSDELLPVGEMVAGQPPIPAGGVAVLTDGGGHGVLAADALTELGVPIAVLAPGTKDRLRALLGRAACTENPVDVAGAGDRDPRVFPNALEILAHDPAVGCVMLVGLFGGYAVRFSEELAEAEAEAASDMAEVMRGADKALVIHSLYASAGTEPLRRLGASGVPVVASLEVASRCVRAAYSRGLYLRHQPLLAPPPPPRSLEPPCMAAARLEGRDLLTESEARDLVAQHGIEVVPAEICTMGQQAVEAAERIGFPVAMKVVSPAVPHKTDAGAVELNLSGVEEVTAAFDRIVSAAVAFATALGVVPDVRGVLVAPMLSDPIAELLVGVRHDHQFGPILTVGSGGIAVEVHRDSVLRGLPVGRDEVLEMLEETRVAPLLRGYRGRPAVHYENLAKTILGIAACALSHPEIAELEVNPLFAYADRVVAVDVRAFLGRGNGLTTPSQQQSASRSHVA